MLNAATGEISGTPTAPGTTNFEVEVTSAGSTDTQTLSITISAPSTATVYFEEDFESANLASHGWYDNTSLTLTSAEKVSGSKSLEVRFNQGASTPTLGGASRHLFEETESVYVSYWVKYSSNWVGSGRSYHPHDIYLITKGELNYGLGYPEAGHRYLKKERCKSLMEENASGRPVLIVCKRRCPGKFTELLPPGASNSAWGMFNFWFAPGAGISEPSSGTAF